MKALGVYDALASKIVRGSNIGQTYQFVESGNAELGFVALSQVITRQDGSRWLVPANLYTPIRQDAVLLKTRATNEAARSFLTFMKGPEARRDREIRLRYEVAFSPSTMPAVITNHLSAEIRQIPAVAPSG